MPERILVALSGGVDSSVAAALLQKEGYEVEAAFMKNWSVPISEDNDGCGWQSDFADAQAVANHLGIRLHFFDFETEYQQEVIEPFFADYAAGLTPNPDVVCNRAIKFGLFFERARAMGFDYIATGHYARTWHMAHGTWHMYRGRDTTKDQSYFLWAATSHALSQTLFPVGEQTKIEVRQFAKEFGLPNSERKDSQGICFVGPVDLKAFLKTRLPSKPGPVRSIESGSTVGEHQGVWFYTIGQRRSTGIFGGGLPYYVAKKDLETNTLWVAPGRDHTALYRSEFEVIGLNLLVDQLPTRNLSIQIRYRQSAMPCHLTATGNGLRVNVLAPAWAVTPGQSAVLYRDHQLLGGGVIQVASRQRSHSLPKIAARIAA